MMMSCPTAFMATGVPQLQKNEGIHLQPEKEIVLLGRM
jgi:hypothetical protein